MFELFAGAIHSAQEFKSLRSAFKTLGYHSALALWLLANGRREHVVYCRDWSIALVAEMARAVKKYRVIYEANSLAAIETYMSASFAISKLVGFLQSCAAAQANGVVAVTELLAQQMRKMSKGRRVPVIVVPNAGDDKYIPVPKES